MAHQVETMAYHKVEVPWHGLGKPVEGDLTPAQMRTAATCDWDVELAPCFAMVPDLATGKKVKVNVDHNLLYRNTDRKHLDVVPTDWKPVPNQTIFEFFDAFCAEGKLDMETAGSLDGGRIVWALARMSETFEVVKKDPIKSYMLLTTFHKYGYSTTACVTGVRVVCANTLAMALAGTKGIQSGTDRVVKVSHRREFITEDVQETMGLARERLTKYKEACQFLSSKKAKKEDIVEYFKRIFPMVTTKESKVNELSAKARGCLGVMESQPGAKLGEGTWWQPFNAVTYYGDHKSGKSQDTRLKSSWYGQMRRDKIGALQLALDMARTS